MTMHNDDCIRFKECDEVLTHFDCSTCLAYRTTEEPDYEERPTNEQLEHFKRGGR